MIDEKKLIETFEDMALSWGERHNKESKYRLFEMEEIQRVVENQPKIGEWIPCSERLPEIMEPVLVCDKQRNVCIRAITCEIKGRKYWSQDKYDVIAWQPLPKTYKEQNR